MIYNWVRTARLGYAITVTLSNMDRILEQNYTGNSMAIDALEFGSSVNFLLYECGSCARYWCSIKIALGRCSADNSMYCDSEDDICDDTSGERSESSKNPHFFDFCFILKVAPAATITTNAIQPTAIPATAL